MSRRQPNPSRTPIFPPAAAPLERANPGNAPFRRDDDRGVPLNLPRFHFRQWVDSPFAPRPVAAALTKADAAARWRRVRLTALACAVAWVIANLANAFLRDIDPRDRDLVIPIFAVVTAMMSVVPLYIAWRIDLSAARSRTIILEHRFCPNCYATIADAAARASAFDGCTACEGCKRAWRLPPRPS